jgi:hypothetical protein
MLLYKNYVKADGGHMFDEHDHHIMQRLRTAADGAEEWFCADCGRHVLLRWPPAYEQTVVHPGDEEACHVSAHPTIEIVGAAALAADLVAGEPDAACAAGPAAERADGAGHYGVVQPVDSFVDFGDPESTDGLAPWIALIERLGRSGLS